MDKKLLEKELSLLSKDQRSAAESSERFLRIVAGAGAGKTTTMAMHIVHLLSKGVQPKEIVSFTFTERAAQNMKNRIYEKISKIEPELCKKLGEMHIGTIHAFCFQMLQDHFGFGNHDVLDENEEMAFMLRHGWGFGLGNGGRYTQNCETFLRSISVVYDELITLEDLRQKEPVFFRQFQKYENLLDEHKLLTFSRLIFLLLSKFRENDEPLNYIKHLIVDEYQDINKAQEKLIQLIGKSASVYVVGDPRQCIYQWRGSNDESFDNFLKHFKKAQMVTIPENRRSAVEIVKNANNFAGTLKEKYEPLKATRPDSGDVIKIQFADPANEAELIINEIKRLVEVEKRCNYSEIALLFRSVRTSAEPFIQKLKQKNIPYIVGGKMGLFKRDEAQILGRIFAWLHEKGFWLKGSYQWNDTIKGDDLVKTAKVLWENLLQRKDFPEEKLNEWKVQVLAGSYKGLTECLHELLLILGFLSLDQTNKLHAAIMANIGRFNTLLTDFQSSIVRGGRSLNWKTDLKGLFWFMNTYAYESYEEQPAEDIRGIDAVQLMTIHQAKGLEWLIVIIPCLIEGRFPSRFMGKERDWLISRDLFPAKRYDGGEDDERRLFYVAMTRARDCLVLTYFQRISNATTESPFLGNLKIKPTPVKDKLIETKLNKTSKEEELQTFEGTEIVDYTRCHYFYRLRHLWNYQSVFSPILGFGKSLHHCLRVTSELVKAKKFNPEAALESVFNDGQFHLPFAGQYAKDIATNNAKKTIQNYIEKHKDDVLNVEEVEARLEFPLEKSTIAGRVDVIIGPKGKSLEVRDYKTSDAITTQEEASLQVKLYTLGLNMTKQKISKATIAYINESKGNSQIINVPISEKDLNEAKETALKAIEGIKKGDWQAKTGKHCEKCDYRKICKFTTLPKKTIVKL